MVCSTSVYRSHVVPVVYKRLCPEFFFGAFGAVGRVAAVLPPFDVVQGILFCYLVEAVVLEVDAVVLQVSLLDPQATDAFRSFPSRGIVLSCECSGGESPGWSFGGVTFVFKPLLGLRLDPAFKSLHYRGLAEEACKRAFPLETDLSFLRVVLETWELGIVDLWTDSDSIRRDVKPSIFRVGAEIQFDFLL